MTIRLVETAALNAPKGNKWNCRLISAGEGSSAIYPADVLKESGPTTFAKGTQVFFDHPTDEERFARGGARSIKDYAGVLLEDAAYNESEQALYAPVQFTPRALELVESSYSDIALSIDVHKFELAEDGGDKPTVRKMFGSPLNNIAIVPRGGRDGKIVALIESFRDDPERSDGNERKTMTPEDIKALAEALSAALAPVLKEALTPEPVKPDEDKSEVDVVAVVEAAHEAGLPKAARLRVVEGAQAGKTVETLIEAEKAEIEEITKTLKESAEFVGRVHESGTGTTSYGVSGWSK